MKKMYNLIGAILCLFLTACSSDRYSLNRKEITIVCGYYMNQNESDVSDIKGFNPIRYLEKDEKAINTDEIESIDIKHDIDFDKVGTYKIHFMKDNEDLTEPLILKIVPKRINSSKQKQYRKY